MARTGALLASAGVIALALPTLAQAGNRHHVAIRTRARQTAASAASLVAAQREILALQTRLTALEARLDGQEGGSQTAVAAASQQAADAAATADHALAVADTAQAQAVKLGEGLDRVGWAKDTRISGRMYFNGSTIAQHTAGGPGSATGTGFNIKRMYIGVSHKFSPMFSASVLMDASNVVGESASLNFVPPSTAVAAARCPITGTGAAAVATCPAQTDNLSAASLVGKGFYIKNAYLQATLDPALVIRVGAAQAPWTSYIENRYGFRHIENVMIDRLSYGYTADWGVHVLGDLAGGLFNYQISVTDGGGFRNVKVTKDVDIEGRASVQYKGFWAAGGGYRGKRANAVDSVDGLPTTFRTATRWDAAAGYTSTLFNLGGEYFRASNWSNVTINPATYAYSQDAAQGWDTWGNINLTPKWTIFGRYEWAQPNRITDPRLRDHYLNIGLQWEPVTIIDLALVYKRERVKNGAVATSDGVIGCATSATANAFATIAADGAGVCTGNGTYDEVGVWGQFKF